MTTDFPRWFKSSHSGNGGECVEVAVNLAVSHGTVPVRDSKNADGPTLSIPTSQWTAFVSTLKASA